MEIKIPLRISFIGGGTDFPAWLNKKTGRTISCTFDRYARVSDNGDFWNINNFDNLLKAAKEWYTHFCYSTYAFPEKLKVACEMPPGSGLGTSSALMVGILKYMYLREEKFGNKKLAFLNLPDNLAKEAVEVEREIAEIQGGSQDQYISCFPGVTEFEFHANGFVKPIPLKHYFSYEELSQHLILIDTGIIRRQANLMSNQIDRNTSGENDNYLNNILEAVPIFIDALKRKDWVNLGFTLSYSWKEKIHLSPEINQPEISVLIEELDKIDGVYGTKLMGAGGGGYILTICDDRDKLYPYLTSKGLRCILPNIVDEIIIEGDLSE